MFEAWSTAWTRQKYLPRGRGQVFRKGKEGIVQPLFFMEDADKPGILGHLELVGNPAGVLHRRPPGRRLESTEEPAPGPVNRLLQGRGRRRHVLHLEGPPQGGARPVDDLNGVFPGG